MTSDQIEAERVRFEAWMSAKYGMLCFARYAAGAYRPWINETWQGWLARAEEQYASERNRELEAIGIQVIPLDKKRAEFNRLVDECLGEERGV